MSGGGDSRAPRRRSPSGSSEAAAEAVTSPTSRLLHVHGCSRCVCLQPGGALWSSRSSSSGLISSEGGSIMHQFAGEKKKKGPAAVLLDVHVTKRRRDSAVSLREVRTSESFSTLKIVTTPLHQGVCSNGVGSSLESK